MIYHMLIQRLRVSQMAVTRAEIDGVCVRLLAVVPESKGHS